MFWPLQSFSEFLGVLEDSKLSFSGVWMATSHFPQSEITTLSVMHICVFVGFSQELVLEN
jgi:hypothetical protein